MEIGVPVRSGGAGEAVFAVGANCALGAKGAEVGADLRDSEVVGVAGAVGVPLRGFSG